MVIWITGLSGVGKTTLANALVQHLRPRIQNLVVLDGDNIRAVFNDKLGHSVSERLVQIGRLQSLAEMLEKQGIISIVTAVYSTPDTLEWNRQNFSQYLEIYMRAPLAFLQRRDAKGLYRQASERRLQNVVGVDIPLTAPTSPDLVIDAEAEVLPSVLASRVTSLHPILYGPAAGRNH